MQDQELLVVKNKISLQQAYHEKLLMKIFEELVELGYPTVVVVHILIRKQAQDMLDYYKNLNFLIYNCHFVSILLISINQRKCSDNKSVILTKDNITSVIDTVLYYRIVDPIKCIYQLNNLVGAMLKVTQSVMRVYIEKLFIKDKILSDDIRQTLALTGTTKKMTVAKIISAQADVEAAKIQ
ncbi:unnamed protein product [Paramecium pentaurelia]|uniref:Band 7 domain-containing protein n=1 Tax=Paramecium pentaurelia TaxID=43138 RepID=A0A8S1UEU9_9CILI|nr:unnamed protein product [Paramecium pentaurelia]